MFYALRFESMNFRFSSMTDAPLMVCGRSSLYVSGSLENIIPEKIIGTSMISMGNGC